MSGKHVTLEGPLINTASIIIDSIACNNPFYAIEWRRDELLRRWVGICTQCGRGRTYKRGDEPFVVTDLEINEGLFTIPILYSFLNIPYETW